MDSEVKLYLERAENERDLAKALLDLSQNNEIKAMLDLTEDHTFYSAVISHAYYSIFYSAKALLLTKKIKTDFPEVHKKTLEKFKENFVDTGVLDVELLKIYKKMVIRADELLGLFKLEKGKRGRFTYKKLPQANLIYAKESVDHASKFFKNISKIVDNLEEEEIK